MSDAIDPLDKVLSDVRQERDVKKAWDQRQAQIARFIVNTFRNDLIPIIHEYNTRLTPFNVRLGDLDSSHGRSGASVSSQCSLSLIGSAAFQQAELARLTVSLLEDGQISIAFGGKQIRAELAEDYGYLSGKCTEAKARCLLAELVGVGLRKRDG